VPGGYTAARHQGGFVQEIPFVPESWKEILEFDHATMNWWGFYTSAFVQQSYNQLVNNVVAYLIAAGYTLWLCREVNLRVWYRRSFLLLLVLLPPLTVATSYVFTGILIPGALPAERGFSGVASGFVGFLHIAFIGFIGEKYDYEIGSNLGVSVLILLLLVVGFVQSGFSQPLIYVLGATGVILLLGWLALQRGFKPNRESLADLDKLNLAIISLTMLVLGVLVSKMFPKDFLRDEMFVNIFSHFAGYIWAIPITAAALYFWR